MRQLRLFTKTIKEAPKDEVSINANLLIRAGFIDKLLAGVYSILPLGFRVLKKIEAIIREEMEAVGGEEVFLPSLQPKENWLTTGRWDELDVLFKFTSFYTKTEYALGATHEEVIVPLAKKHINSYKDLPLALFQIQNKFRDEKRAKSGILRGREFLMKDLYSFHASEEDLNKYYDEKIIPAYNRIFERVGISDKTYLTYASGGTFSKFSHEFQTLTEAGEDLIYICDKCRIAINEEIIEDLKNQCPQCESKDLRKEKAVEVGNIFKLMTKYSAPFGLTFTDEKGENKPVIMGCYGIGLQRLMGTIVEVCNDGQGIVWPDSVAPFKIHLISLKQNEMADKIYSDLKKNMIEVLYDDREESSAGEKFKDADLIGCPIRLVVSEKTISQDSVELKRRNSDQTQLVKIQDLIKAIE